MTLFEELQLLKEFEKRENVLAAKVDIKIKERSDMQAKVRSASIIAQVIIQCVPEKEKPRFIDDLS